ncbi:MAG: hypothetical protein IT223_00820 [Crocinitomicaceae bacterium]|nr:hypothetical protein [Crocinitomicaceae bacterium]
MSRNMNMDTFRSTIIVMNPLFVLVAVMMTLGATAQIDSTLTQSAEFEGERRIFLRDANKLSTNPLVKEQVSEMTSIKYTTLPTRKIATIEPQLIKAAKINVDEKLGKLYKGYVKAGYGTFFTPIGDFFYTDGRSKNGTFGVHYQHLSSAGGVTPNDKDSIPDNFSDNKAEIWGKYFFQKSMIQGGFNWERNVYHWYGIDNNLFDASDSRVKMDQLKQRLNTFGGNASYQTYHRDTSELNYRFDLAIRGTNDLFKGRETNID